MCLMLYPFVNLFLWKFVLKFYKTTNQRGACWESEELWVKKYKIGLINGNY